MTVAPRRASLRSPAVAPRDFLFVYGSLMKGAPRHRLLGVPHDARFLAPARARGLLYDIGLYPGMTEGEGMVQGELYLVVEAALGPRIDRYEDFDPSHPDAYGAGRHGSEFRRVRVRLAAPQVSAWTYLFTGPTASLAPIPDGRWRPPRGRQAPPR